MSNRSFKELIDGFDQLLKGLKLMEPIRSTRDFEFGNQDKFISGVYLFSENGKDLYVGRSRNIRRRYSDHTCNSPNSAAFAVLLAREKTGKTNPSYVSGSESLKDLMQNSDFKAAFDEGRDRKKKMEFRYIEESCANRQALLEIYCAVELNTCYNKFRTH